MLSFSFCFGFQVFDSFTSSAFFPAFLCLFCFLLSFFFSLFVWSFVSLTKTFSVQTSVVLFLAVSGAAILYLVNRLCSQCLHYFIILYLFFRKDFYCFVLSSFCPFLSIFVSVPLNFISSVFLTSFLSLLIFGFHFCLFKHFFDRDIFC